MALQCLYYPNIIGGQQKKTSSFYAPNINDYLGLSNGSFTNQMGVYPDRASLNVEGIAGYIRVDGTVVPARLFDQSTKPATITELPSSFVPAKHDVEFRSLEHRSDIIALASTNKEKPDSASVSKISARGDDPPKQFIGEDSRNVHNGNKGSRSLMLYLCRSRPHTSQESLHFLKQRKFISDSPNTHFLIENDAELL